VIRSGSAHEVVQHWYVRLPMRLFDTCGGYGHPWRMKEVVNLVERNLTDVPEARHVTGSMMKIYEGLLRCAKTGATVVRSTSRRGVLVSAA